jgi:hypothetical protein
MKYSQRVINTKHRVKIAKLKAKAHDAKAAATKAK